MGGVRNDSIRAHRAHAYKAYIGAGAHATPPNVLNLMVAIARFLAEQGCVLRSGGSPGADAAFETECGSGPNEIYLPYAGFNRHPSPLALTDELLHHSTQHDVWHALRADLARETPAVELDRLPVGLFRRTRSAALEHTPQRADCRM
jgi:hypothetical protein